MVTSFFLSKSVTSISLDISEIALLLFGVLLVVGLGEYARSERWKKYIRAFEMFVIIGVAGELLADGGVFLFSKHLQTIADLEIANVTQKAGDADTSAEDAALAASHAKSSADAAETAAAKAQQKVEAIAKRAEELNRKLAQTQYLISARSVYDLESLVTQLKQFKGQAVDVVSYASDGDGYFLCESIYGAAHSAEMEARDDCGRVSPSGQLVTGIAISGPDTQQTMTLAEMVVHTANTGGGAASAIKAPTLTIFVGIKSPFMIGQTRPVTTGTGKKQINRQAR